MERDGEMRELLVLDGLPLWALFATSRSLHGGHSNSHSAHVAGRKRARGGLVVPLLARTRLGVLLAKLASSTLTVGTSSCTYPWTWTYIRSV